MNEARELFKNTNKNPDTKLIDVQDTHTDELVIGLCGPIGSRLHPVADILTEVLKSTYDYDVKKIRLSEIIKANSTNDLTKKDGKYAHVKALITAGNKLREEYGSDVLSKLAITKMAEERASYKTKCGKNRNTTRRICYIIDSIKNKKELTTLKSVYGDIFYCFGVYSLVGERIKDLEDDMEHTELITLIDKDSGEEQVTGQSVKKTFPLSDFFIHDEGQNNEIKKKIQRCLHLIFGSELVTPTVQEKAMYHAAAAARNSGCMSRQVGACIVDKNGEILSVGWNDVPKAFGGVYGNDPKNDNRCFNYKSCECYNQKWQQKVAEDVFTKLLKEKLIKQDTKTKVLSVLHKTRVFGLIEFSRSIHAEMNAIILGAQKNSDKMIGGSLYCTTFPCHNCARHIVVAGIQEIYYIEPYRKSLALKLHDDVLTERANDKTRVRIRLFDGVSPSRYMDFFSITQTRKDTNGKKTAVDTKEITPCKTSSLESFPTLEELIVAQLIKIKLITPQKES